MDCPLMEKTISYQNNLIDETTICLKNLSSQLQLLKNISMSDAKDAIDNLRLINIKMDELRQYISMFYNNLLDKNWNLTEDTRNILLEEQKSNQLLNEMSPFILMYIMMKENNYNELIDTIK
jgi:hypothetical protein